MQPNIDFEFRERYRTCAVLLLLLVPLEFWSQVYFFGEAMIAGLLAPFLTAIPFRLRMDQLPGKRSFGELEPAR